MQRTLRKWATELLLLSVYKYIFEFVFLKLYMDIFGYMYSGTSYVWDAGKWMLGNVAFAVFAVLLIRNRPVGNPVYTVLIRFIYCMGIIPMLGVYSFLDGIRRYFLVFPAVFYFILIIGLKWFGSREEGSERISVRIPRIRSLNSMLIVLFGAVALLVWAMTGFPVALNFGEAYSRRMSLRLAALPTVLNYLFMIIGGTGFPYLFAKNWAEKRYLKSLICLAFGLLLFFVNGMKTWLLLYPMFFGIVILRAVSSSEEHTAYVTEFLFVVAASACVMAYRYMGNLGLVSQFARVTMIPNKIGFNSVRFFSQNELLYLRESILRGIMSTPYKGGSDFYINYGSNITATTSRANNGLWGDAFRNFGAFGMLIYPVVIAGVFHVVERACRGASYSFRLFVLVLILWSAINTSFFTWLLTGGVIVIILIASMDSRQDFSITLRRGSYEYE